MVSAPRVRSSQSVLARSRRHQLWVAATLALIVCGAVASFAVARAVANNNTDASVRSFQRSSASVASTLQLAIEHDNDIQADAGGVLAQPNVSQTGFIRWADSARLLARYPEVEGIASLVLVTAADLPAFAKKAEADPPDTMSATGHFEVKPAGARPYYCFVSAGVGRGSSSTAGTPFDVDFCADKANRAVLLATRDSGLGAYLPYTLQGHDLLVIQTPIYRLGAATSTVAERRSAFVAWVGTQLNPALVLERALQGQAGLSVTMRYHVGAQDVSFSSGKAAAGSTSVTSDLHNGWVVQTSGVIDSAGFGERNVLIAFSAGTTVSVLLALLMFVLGTGRERARRQLQLRTSELHHQALHDALTGLPNRLLVMDRIEQMLVRDRRQHAVGAALFLDLDDFKNVNDTLGHGAGDRLLVAVADRIKSALREADTLGRMGGDEFVVLIDDTTVDVAPELVAERILEAMRRPFELGSGSKPLTVNISIGIASGDRDNADDLLRDADVALYQAKAAGKNRYVTFDPHTQAIVGLRTDLDFDLQSALTHGEYRLVYQPIYNLDDLTVVGVEALLRWNHPTRGLISPDEFVPLLEQTGQIGDVGRWVLNKACRQMAAWHAKGDTLDVSVNVSGHQLDHDSLVDDIRNALQSSGLPASSLIIEITETALMRNADDTARRLHAVKELGVKIAVDDFGTGYSSLAYLRRFPVDSLKIDRMFTNAVTTSPESTALIATLVQLGKDLGLSTLAEGVETTEEMDLLRSADVNLAQGFLMAHPLDPDTLESRLLAPTRPTSPVNRDVASPTVNAPAKPDQNR